ncbi:MAG: hypothetical protein JW944_02410 [Deltaproteobacteria bacterium]|nr:hypothetical protein [Deltaproteobacteria bacterium]
MELIKRTLLRRLIDKGIEGRTLAAFIRDMINSFGNTEGHDLKRLEYRLRSLGWVDFELDEYTYQLIIANLETKTLDRYRMNDCRQKLAI